MENETYKTALRDTVKYKRIPVPLYNISDIVYLKTDVDQKERIVTGILIQPQGIEYRVCCGADITYHFDFEITTDKAYNT